MQEAYVRALAHLSAFRGDAFLSAWWRIVINEARGRLRKGKRAAVMPDNPKALARPDFRHRSARRLKTSFFSPLCFRRRSVRGPLQGHHFLDQGQQIALGSVGQRHDLLREIHGVVRLLRRAAP